MTSRRKTPDVLQPTFPFSTSMSPTSLVVAVRPRLYSAVHCVNASSSVCAATHIPSAQAAPAQFPHETDRFAFMRILICYAIQKSGKSTMNPRRPSQRWKVYLFVATNGRRNCPSSVKRFMRQPICMDSRTDGRQVGRGVRMERDKTDRATADLRIGHDFQDLGHGGGAVVREDQPQVIQRYGIGPQIVRQGLSIPGIGAVCSSQIHARDFQYRYFTGHVFFVLKTAKKIRRRMRAA